MFSKYKSPIDSLQDKQDKQGKQEVFKNFVSP